MEGDRRARSYPQGRPEAIRHIDVGTRPNVVCQSRRRNVPPPGYRSNQLAFQAGVHGYSKSTDPFVGAGPIPKKAVIDGFQPRRPPPTANGAGFRYNLGSTGKANEADWPRSRVV